MAEERERGLGTGLVVGGAGGAALATAIAILLAARPARAAPTDEKLDYLIEVLTTLVPVLAEVSEGQTELIAAMQQWLAAQGIPVAPAAEGVEVTVLTPWVAKEPELIYNTPIRIAGTYFTDKLVDCRNVKRILFKVESSLNQAVSLQLIGSFFDSPNLATDIGAALPCPANANISVGPAWGDWHPFMGLRLTLIATPASGFLKIWAVVQE